MVSFVKDLRTFLKKYELILPMAPLFHCFSVKFSTLPTPNKFVAVCISDLDGIDVK